MHFVGQSWALLHHCPVSLGLIEKIKLELFWMQNNYPSQAWVFLNVNNLIESSSSFLQLQKWNRVKVKFFKTRNLAMSSNDYTVYVYDCINFESSMSSFYIFSPIHKNTYRSISDENSHFPQESNVYISD
jgi:hypothetical protein